MIFDPIRFLLKSPNCAVLRHISLLTKPVVSSAGNSLGRVEINDTSVGVLRIKSVSVRSLRLGAVCQLHFSSVPVTMTSTAEPVSDPLLNGLDEIQKKLLDEECILIDENDQRVGAASKKVCHLLENINKGMLHRAFSVFLFNSAGELLIQQRSPAKITFPRHWTNTCCSHPLNFDLELNEQNAGGVKSAAQRKLQHELGIEPDQVPLSSFQYLTRIHYKSPNVPADNTWGEHEIDYVLVAQRDVSLQPNENEVMDQRYVNRQQLKELIDCSQTDSTVLITPWFKLIVDKFLWTWWDRLDNLQSCKDHKTIHRMC